MEKHSAVAPGKDDQSMSLFIAFAVVVAAGTFLLALGATALVRPSIARRFLLGLAQSAARHYLELAIRFAIGSALIVAAPRMAGTHVVAGAGIVLLATTAVMFFVPWRSHQSFANSAVPRALAFLPAIGLSSIAVGVALLWALLGAGAG
jgi:hypothetical protein